MSEILKYISMTPTQRKAIENAQVALAKAGRWAEVNALRAALAEPVGEPVSHQYQDSTGKWCDFTNERHFQNTVKDGRWPIRALYTAPQAQPAVEPVAWRAKDANGRWMYGNLPAPELPADAPQLLFASPPPPAEVPLLSDFEISDIFQKSNKPGSSHGDFARAIEKAVRQKAGLK